MNSLNGNPTLTNGIKNLLVDAEAICRIIAASSKANVRELSFGDLHLSFGPPDQGSAKNTRAQTKPSEEIIRKIDDEVHTEELVNELRSDVDQLKLTDPYAYEKFVEGELEGANSP